MNKKACKYTPQIVESSKNHRIEPEIMIGLIFVESSFHRKVESSAGACGLTQIIPKYTGKITKKYSCDYLKRNPLESIDAGAKILRWWIDWHTENQLKKKYAKEDILKRALCSYNAGFRCSGKRPSKGGMRYSLKVLKKAKLIKIQKKSYLSN
tara:strand:+ start:822 stop:1280 length:459 start_codon:yes stop_codon:yes gene_type:complete